MFRRYCSSIRNLLTAVLLLGLFLCALESYLQVAAPVTGESGAGQFRSDLDVAFLTPSATSHHELKRMASFPRVAGANEESVVIRTNSLGLRGPEPQQPRRPGVYRVLMLGDDTVFGADLKEEDCVCEALSHWLNQYSSQPVEVINASVPGYCPLLSAMQFQHSLQALSPDLVILHFDMNDVADDYHYRRFLKEVPSGSAVCSHPLLDRSTATQSQGLSDIAARSAVAQKFGEWIESLLSDGHRDEAGDIIGKNTAYAWIQDSPPNWKTYVRHAVSPVETLRQSAAASGIPFVLSTVPAPWQVGPELVDAEVSQRFEMPHAQRIQTDLPMRILGSFAEPRGVPFCDPTPQFRQAAVSHQLYLRDRPRLSPDGHRLYARELARTIISNVPGEWILPTQATSPRQTRAPGVSGR